MANDTKNFVQACTTCAKAKTTNSPSPGNLQLFPVPHHSWANITLDKVTGLLEFEGKNIILNIVDRFSKAVHLVALSGLHILELHGFPKILSQTEGLSLLPDSGRPSAI